MRAWFLIGLAWALPLSAFAQEASPEAAPAAAAQAESSAPPVLVVPIAGSKVGEEASAAIVAALIEQLRPHVQRRDVTRLEAPEALAAAAACTDATCIGGLVASAGAVSGVIVRMDRRRTRDPIAIGIEVVDPVSGNPRAEAATLELAADVAPTEALAPLVDGLRALMPRPPPRTTLLIAANVDEADVTVNGRAIGTTPLPPGELPPGTYVVAISKEGFLPQRRSVNVNRGQSARVDFDLEPSAEQAAADALGDSRDPSWEGEPNRPFYEDPLVLGAAGGAVALTVAVIVIVVATSGSSPIPVPPLQ